MATDSAQHAPMKDSSNTCNYVMLRLTYAFCDSFLHSRTLPLLLKKEKGFLEGCFSEKLGWQVLAGEAAL